MKVAIRRDFNTLDATGPQFMRLGALTRGTIYVGNVISARLPDDAVVWGAVVEIRGQANSPEEAKLTKSLPTHAAQEGYVCILLLTKFHLDLPRLAQRKRKAAGIKLDPAGEEQLATTRWEWVWGKEILGREKIRRVSPASRPPPGPYHSHQPKWPAQLAVYHY
ncbi:hypothetical protein BD779DRAFT_1568841 [Infundibulicybe gibba]|nr:hypothetical protein BD779DRAFT_1568841 [Infundibulicybe gibba]